MLILFILLWVMVYFTKVYFTMVYDLFFLSFTLSGERIYLLFVTTGPRSTFVHGVEMDGTKKKRECALGQFTRYERKIVEALQNKITNKWALDKMYEELKERFKE